MDFTSLATCEEKKFKCKFALNQDIPNKCILELTNLIGLEAEFCKLLKKSKNSFLDKAYSNS